MYTRVDKSKQNKSRSVAKSVPQKKSIERQGFGFVDNRPESKSQMNWQMTSRHPIQMQVIDRRTGQPGYWDAKKIQTTHMGTKWWQFQGQPMSPITGDFQNNAIGNGTYQGTPIPPNDYGANPVIAATSVESQTSGHMEMASGELRPLSQVSDGAIFAKATRNTGHNWQGTNNTWHHGATLGRMYLLDTAIHSAFAPHIGWASQGGNRNEMGNFIDYTGNTARDDSEYSEDFESYESSDFSDDY